MTMTMEPNVAFERGGRNSAWPTPDVMSEARRLVRMEVIGDDLPGWLPPVVDRLNELGARARGCDDSSSSQPTVEAIIACIEALRTFMPHSGATPAVLPTRLGGIQLEWHMGQWDLEVDFAPDGSSSFWGEDHMSGQVITEETNAHEDLTLALKALSERRIA